MPPEEWALLERYLLQTMGEAAEVFVGKYTRDDGTLLWRDAWPGMDGSDDGYESYGNFTLFYALGGGAKVLALARRGWHAVTRQFTEYGQVYREFDAYYDWMHHGESSHLLYGFGLCDDSMHQRTVAFARMYTGDDPEAENYDRERRQMRSPINGSRGPRFVNSWVDWETHRPILAGYPPPFEDLPGAPGPLCDWTDDALYAAVLERLNARMMRGDVPLNLTATGLVTAAYLATGDAAYRDWVLDYTAAWRERAERNGGLLPDNIGPNGAIGELCGAWYGGYYGWRWPHGFLNLIEPALIAASCCLLLTGDATWLEFPRSQLRLIAAAGRREEGWLLIPNRHGSQGWYDFRRADPRFWAYLAYLSQDPGDAAALADLAPERRTVHGRRGKGDQEHLAPWLAYLAGDDPGYPVCILRAAATEMYRRLELIRADDLADAPSWDVHHWQDRNPVGTEALVQLTLGGPSPIYHGGLLHTRLRWFDPGLRRAGLPAGVAVLVERIEPEAVVLAVQNVEPWEPRRLVVQAGAYAEHAFCSLAVEGGGARPLEARSLELDVAPGALLRLRLGQRRYAHAPTFAPPWERPGG